MSDVSYMWAFEGSKLAAMPPATRDRLSSVWLSLDGQQGLAYAAAPVAGDRGWQALTEAQVLAGSTSQTPAPFHYTVITDVDPAVEEEFNAWYATEHLPGLASVPGTMCARRFVRLGASPRYLACYDLSSPQVLERPEWLAVRHTAWSSRIRPFFRNTQRVMYQRAP
jgi:hypothetical protein